ncbi:MAG: type 4a pilus biogenesis protein PilO [Parahaliea sp.]
MAMEDTLRAFREFDINDLSLDNIGMLPMPIKIVMCILLFSALIGLGFYFHISDLQKNYSREVAQESTLKKDFEEKSFKAANLDAYRKQMVEMEESFGALIKQLPSDTEVPGLLEDITNKGQINGLDIKQIDLKSEISREFYVELPIYISATGSYHDLGAFVSGMAGLPRIVTLHDFTITASGTDTSKLHMQITAKTYRYKDGGS